MLNFLPLRFLSAEVFRSLNRSDEPVADGLVPIRPRVGAFEVYLETYCIYSKLNNGLWPHIPSVVRKLQKAVEAHAEGGDLTPYIVEPKSPEKGGAAGGGGGGRLTSMSPPS